MNEQQKKQFYVDGAVKGLKELMWFGLYVVRYAAPRFVLERIAEYFYEYNKVYEQRIKRHESTRTGVFKR